MPASLAEQAITQELKVQQDALDKIMQRSDERPPTLGGTQAPAKVGGLPVEYYQQQVAGVNSTENAGLFSLDQNVAARKDLVFSLQGGNCRTSPESGFVQPGHSAARPH